MKIFLVLLIGFFSFFSAETNTEKIRWSESYQLSWADFQGVPQGGSGYVASTNSGMSFTFSFGSRNGEINYDYSIESNFYPKLSWYKKGQVSDYILKHEQTHFDISELHTRMFRKRMEESQFSDNIKAEVGALYEKTETERKEMQKQYDLESNHSQDTEAEHQWRNFVAEQLKAHDRWK